MSQPCLQTSSHSLLVLIKVGATRVTFWEEEKQIEAGESLGKVLFTIVLPIPSPTSGPGQGRGTCETPDGAESQ